MAQRKQNSGCVNFSQFMANLDLKDFEIHLAAKYARLILSSALAIQTPEKGSEASLLIPLFQMGKVNDKTQELCLELNPRALEIFEGLTKSTENNSPNLTILPANKPY